MKKDHTVEIVVLVAIAIGLALISVNSCWVLSMQ